MKKLILLTILCFGSFLLAEGISGVTYFGYSMYNINNAFGEKRGFELNRVYLTYKKEISEKASFKFQADMQNKISSADNEVVEVEGQAYYMYIKNAKFDLKVAKGTKFIIGMQGMNMFNVAEKTWGNRFLSKSAMDEEGWSASADLGIGISQSFGDISASLLMTNGEGYKSKSEDYYEKISFQAMYGEKRLDKKDGFNFGGVYSTLTYASVEDDEDTPDMNEKEEIAGTVMGVFGGFSGFGVRIGFDYNMGTNLDIDNYGASSTLMSFYASYSLPLFEELSIMGRYDMVDPGVENKENTNIDDSVEDDSTTILVGLIYKCTDGLSVSPNIIQTKTTTGTEMTSGGGEESVIDFNLSFQFKF